jgi:hypothetical protein
VQLYYKIKIATKRHNKDKSDLGGSLIYQFILIFNFFDLRVCNILRLIAKGEYFGGRLGEL